MSRTLYTDLLRNDINVSSKSKVLRLALVYWDQGGECWVDLNTESWFETKSPSTPS
jgi:hypothetical protein